MLSINMNDVINVINSIKTYLIAMGAIILAAIIIQIAVSRMAIPMTMRVLARTWSGRRNIRIAQPAASSGITIEEIPKVPATTVCTAPNTGPEDCHHSTTATRVAMKRRNSA